jgi:hypothetical protein
MTDFIKFYKVFRPDVEADAASRLFSVIDINSDGKVCFATNSHASESHDYSGFCS